MNLYPVILQQKSCYSKSFNNEKVSTTSHSLFHQFFCFHLCNSKDLNF